MRHAIGAFIGVVLVIPLLGCPSDPEQPTFTNPYDPRNAEDLPIPDSIQVTVGNNFVRLDWSIDDSLGVDEYAVFRTRIDNDGAEELMGEVSGRFFEDNRARNGRLYEYTVAAGMDGRFGQRSDGVVANPGQFSIVIADDSPKTRNRNTEVSLNSTIPISTIRLSEDPDFTDAPWRPASQPASMILSAGDGEKTVYGRFGFDDGSESIRVVDFIELDTQAVIRLVDFSGPDISSPGSSIHFRLDAGELNGFASIDVTGLFSDLTLVDDGTLGDTTPDDGVYERDTEIPAGSLVSNAAVRGSFQDEVGNQAGSTDASRTLTVQNAPDPITLITVIADDPPSDPGATIRWTQSQDADFDSYQVFRAQAHTVDSSDHLVGSIFSRGTLEVKDSGVTEGEMYSYRVYVRSGSGLETGSNIVKLLVPNERPPGAATLEVPDAVGFSRLALQWNKSDAADFASYQVFRNETGAVTEEDSLISEISDINLTFFDDSGLRENTRYHYRVYVLDTASLFSRSNEVTGTTKNEPPSPVTLDPPVTGGSGEVLLSWTISDAHDFAFYRLYQDSVSTVSTASELVIELDELEATEFEIRGLDSSQHFFRVFVFDDGDNPGPGSAGSNTVSINTTSSITQGDNQDAHTSGVTGRARDRK